MSWLFGKQANDEDQGGFSDTSSKITYTNESKSDALDQAALFDEREDGSSLLTHDDDDPKNAPDDARFNCTIMDTDDQGFEYPARHRPGR